MFLRLSLILLLTTSIFALENNFGTDGYIRVQTTLDDKKANVCFKAPGAGTKYRLGNECETWLEIALYQDLTLDSGVKIHNQVRPVFTAPNNKTVDFLRFDEAYSEVFNTFDNSVSFWIGRRFYKRYDSFISDYFFFNISGDGFGINNLDLGKMNLSYSFIFNKVDPNIVDGEEYVLFQSHDLRFKKNTARGDITLYLNYMLLDSKNFNVTQKIKKVDGYTIGLLYKDKDITNELFGMSGENITGLFYGTGISRGAGSYSPYLQEPLIDDMINTGNNIDNSKSIRFINYNGFENNSIGIMSNLVYEYKNDKEFSDTNQNWYSIGVRPYLFLHNNFRVMAELGYDLVDDKVSNEKYKLSKFTSAVEFAFKKGIWERPVLRLYYTKAEWSANSKGQVGTSYYTDKTNGDTVGVQLEYWW